MSSPTQVDANALLAQLSSSGQDTVGKTLWVVHRMLKITEEELRTVCQLPEMNQLNSAVSYSWRQKMWHTVRGNAFFKELQQYSTFPPSWLIESYPTLTNQWGWIWQCGRSFLGKTFLLVYFYNRDWRKNLLKMTFSSNNDWSVAFCVLNCELPSVAAVSLKRGHYWGFTNIHM